MFKKCPCCGAKWPTRNKFLTDQSLKLHGYQVNFKSLEMGLLLFTHHAPSCNTTMAVDVAEFFDLFTGTRYTVNKAKSPECPRYCFDESNLARCTVFCECAFVRDVMWSVQILKAI
ncbi:hypothetical protein FO488_10205 [Geobacter sp. FeAm09]|uniref:hypothetical protein n=1 Tax=Geobacter sp. FeAm09 TaxID=2597769 RepID=UPI0011ED6319|nr:hypothetical protein [Geobacter sp. FeAm09]QEM68505.1 hypothetical protein FO488_10205 [Geobacter sp. FeAm09]